MPKISVVLPVYNGANYLKEAIESILRQTFSDFELIIVNDGSTDNSLQIINEYIDPRIILINQPNKGFPESLNIAIASCSGKYIARMDQDDISLPHRLMEQYLFLESHPSVSVLSNAVEYIDDQGNVLGRSFPVTNSMAVKKKLLKSGNVINHPSVIFKKNIIELVNGYNETVGGRFTDYHLWVKIISSGYKVKNLPKVLLQYRIIETSMSSEFVMDQTATQLLLRLVRIENPSPNEVQRVTKACINTNQDVKPRSSAYNNIENRLYLKLSFFSDSFREKLFSSLNNIYTLVHF